MRDALADAMRLTRIPSDRTGRHTVARLRLLLQRAPDDPLAQEDHCSGGPPGLGGIRLRVRSALPAGSHAGETCTYHSLNIRAVSDAGTDEDDRPVTTVRHHACSFCWLGRRLPRQFNRCGGRAASEVVDDEFREAERIDRLNRLLHLVQTPPDAAGDDHPMDAARCRCRPAADRRPVLARCGCPAVVGLPAVAERGAAAPRDRQRTTTTTRVRSRPGAGAAHRP